MNINKKNVYLLSPKFFGYENDIALELKKLGANVFLFDEKPFKSTFGKALIRFNLNKIIHYHKKKYFKEILIKNANNIDILIIINPESIYPKILENVKKTNPKVKIITYMWDSFLNKPEARKLISVSNSFFTFDPKDAERYSLRKLPLFYVSEYKKINFKRDFKYNSCFIGTAHSQRFSLVKKITKNLNRNFLFFYTPSLYVFLYKKFICQELNNLKLKDISTKKMSREDIISVFNNTKVIIDINHPSQIGLTMRTIETLGAKRKLITTNIEVINYDFYHENNILYYNEKITPEDIQLFIEKPYIPINNSIYESYHISSWIKKLIS
ncbi:hypothetical protein [Providencia sp. PROV266]|uniref:hypothetical protein n=1 Tax=Providencia sp. PROV266 TaxID=2949954 RepID=UPI002349AE64